MLSDLAATSVLAAIVASLLGPAGRPVPPTLLVAPFSGPLHVECQCRYDRPTSADPSASWGAWVPYFVGLLLFFSGAALGC